jgi:hypothetical protein
MYKFAATALLMFLLTGCQTIPNASNGDASTPAPTTLSFIDFESFDGDLQRALNAGTDKVTINFFDNPSPNKTPVRLQKWIAKMQDAGGTIQIETPPNELTPKNPFALISMITSLWTGNKAIKELNKDKVFSSIDSRNAVIQLERNSKGELLIGQVVFIKR